MTSCCIKKPSRARVANRNSLGTYIFSLPYKVKDKTRHTRIKPLCSCFVAKNASPKGVLICKPKEIRGKRSRYRRLNHPLHLSREKESLSWILLTNLFRWVTTPRPCCRWESADFQLLVEAWGCSKNEWEVGCWWSMTNLGFSGGGFYKDFMSPFGLACFLRTKNLQRLRVCPSKHVYHWKFVIKYIDMNVLYLPRMASKLHCHLIWYVFWL